MDRTNSKHFCSALAALLAVAMAAQVAFAQVSVIRGNDMVDRIGVNTHIPYQWSSYWDADKTVADLKFLGITKVRDLQVGTLTTEQQRFGKLADAGIGIDYIFKYTIPDGIARIETFSQAHPNSVYAIEGPNEISNQPITYAGLTGQAAGAAYQAALYDAVKASPILSQTPVYSLSDSRADPAKLDYSNSHPYARQGVQPFAALQKSFTSWTTIYPGKPVVFTETGYHTQLGNMGGVDVATQATLTINSVLDAFWLGISKVYFYELLDEGSAAKIGGEWHFGLFYNDHTPKPAAKALANFITLVRDTKPATVAPAFPSFAYTTTGLPSTAKTIRIAKDNGMQILAVWNEPAIWNSTTEKPITITKTKVTLNFGKAVGGVSVYDPVTGVQPVIAQLGGRSSIDIQLGDHPLLVAVALN